MIRNTAQRKPKPAQKDKSLTATFEEDRRQTLECGMNAHIAKPIDMEKLLENRGKINLFARPRSAYVLG